MIRKEKKFAFSCTKENISTSITAQSKTNSVTSKHVIGEHYGGGIIFYLDSTQEHGLIAATQDQGIATWYNGELL